MRVSEPSNASAFSLKKLLPLILIAIVAIAAFFGLKDYLSFDALRTFFTVVGATIGATAIYMAAKLGLGDKLYEGLKGDGKTGMLSKVEAGLREDEVSYLFLMRLVPAFPFFVANLAPAFLGVKLRNFVFTTFFGIIPGTAVYTWVGSGLGEVFARGETPNLGIIFQPVVLGPILGLCALSILPIVIKKLRKGGAK